MISARVINEGGQPNTKPPIYMAANDDGDGGYSAPQPPLPPPPFIVAVLNNSGNTGVVPPISSFPPMPYSKLMYAIKASVLYGKNAKGVLFQKLKDIDKAGKVIVLLGENTGNAKVLAVSVQEYSDLIALGLTKGFVYTEDFTDTMPTGGTKGSVAQTASGTATQPPVKAGGSVSDHANNATHAPNGNPGVMPPLGNTADLEKQVKSNIDRHHLGIIGILVAILTVIILIRIFK